VLAPLAALFFAIALILDLARETLDRITPTTLLFAGLLCLALHLAGVGSSYNWRTRARR
jgi:cell division protein FtsW (lipid II flippase)